MLKELHIENIAVIEKTDICFHSGLNILTGETGAGKSIIIDSILAVMGERTSKELVRHGAPYAVVTATFDSDGLEDWLRDNDIECDDELILTRKISPDGKSSCRICGLPAAAQQVRSLAALLIDVHGQNDGRQLLDERNHLHYLDLFGDYQPLIDEYRKVFARLKKINSEIERLSSDEIDKDRLRDALTFRISEIRKAELRSGEYEELSARRDLLHNSEKITENLSEALKLLDENEENAVSLAQNASYFASRAASYAEELTEASNEISEASFSLSNAAEQIRDFFDRLDFSPEEYDRIESRLALLNRLRKKYSAEEDELLEKLDAWEKQLNEIDNSDELLKKLTNERSAVLKECIETGKRLSIARKKTGLILQKRIEHELTELNMPSARFIVQITGTEDNEPASTGIDQVFFVMSANPGETPGKISKIASGGELSRIMLALKNVFAEKDPVFTMIFDEIDTGVSGIAAQRVAEKLYFVSRGKQVMCVTHLPQIAAMADSHYLIKKAERDGRTFTQVSELDTFGRQKELARLYGGEHITELTLAGAKEQILAAEEYKRKIG